MQFFRQFRLNFIWIFEKKLKNTKIIEIQYFSFFPEKIIPSTKMRTGIKSLGIGLLFRILEKEELLIFRMYPFLD